MSVGWIQQKQHEVSSLHKKLLFKPGILLFKSGKSFFIKVTKSMGFSKIDIFKDLYACLYPVAMYLKCCLQVWNISTEVVLFCASYWLVLRDCHPCPGFSGRLAGQVESGSKFRRPAARAGLHHRAMDARHSQCSQEVDVSTHHRIAETPHIGQTGASELRRNKAAQGILFLLFCTEIKLLSLRAKENIYRLDYSK